jgi:anaerobic selenocysteine-containing dehydrogenase
MRGQDDFAVTAEAVCPYCGVGCRLWGEIAYGRLLRVKGADGRANQGRICPKGATLDKVLDTPDRLSKPLMRASRYTELKPVSWDRALDAVAGRLQEIVRQHGPDAVAFYGSGQLDTETVYLAGKLFKGSIGTNNTDSNSRLCMAAAVAGYRTSLGSDGPPPCYDDIDHADLVLVAGSNMAEAHPITWGFVHDRHRTGACRVVVIDPRRTATAREADLHLPVQPGGDIALFNYVAKQLIESDRIDRGFVERHTTGFQELADYLGALDAAGLANASGCARAELDRLADLLADSKAVLSFYCMGINQSTVGMWKNNVLINLHLLTGQIGRPGAGPFSLTGQPNAMGGREAGLLSHQLPGYRFVEDAAHRSEIEQHWGRPAGTISPRPGLTAVEMFRALERGTLKAIWIAATNPLVSLPDLHHVRRAIQRAELVVVSDCYQPTETTQAADIVLPAAQWAEKPFFSTNSERMVAYSEAMILPPGEARPDWMIVRDVARRMGYSGFDYETHEQVWDDYIRCTAGRLCDMSGMTADRLRLEKELRWPCPGPASPGGGRLYEDLRFPTPDGRARLLARPHTAPREHADHEFPFWLTTGRIAAQWHTRTRTGKVPVLNRKAPGPWVEVNTADAIQCGITDGQEVRLSTRRGTVRVPARVTAGCPAGVLFMPFHWGDSFGDETAANYLTHSAIGRVAKQPEFKVCAAMIEPVPTRVDALELAGCAGGAMSGE